MRRANQAGPGCAPPLPSMTFRLGVNSPDSIDKVTIQDHELLHVLPVVELLIELVDGRLHAACISGSFDNDARSVGFP